MDELLEPSKKRGSCRTKKNSWQQAAPYDDGRIDYKNYKFTYAELALNILIALILCFAIGHYFYDSYLACALLTVFIPWFLKYRRKSYGQKRRDEFRNQFADAICSVSTNQKAGYSIEKSFREAWNDMNNLYGKKSIICKELDIINRGLDNNIILEQMLLDMGNRSGIDDIRQFGEVFAIAKRNGGNMTEMIEMTASMIGEKADIENEIEVMISSRKMEANIMSLVPILMIAYMQLTSQGFFDELYHNLAGVVIMSICLAIYAAAYLISQRLVNIRI